MNGIPEIIKNVLSMILWPAVVGLTVVMIVYAGIMFITASGDPERLTKAKAAVIWAVVGLVVAILAYSVPAIITEVITK
jgi:hypothetical protein